MFCPNGLTNFLIQKLKKWHLRKKKSEEATACLFHLRLQAIVATITELKREMAPFNIIVRNLMMGAPGKGDKRHIPSAMTSSYDQIACYVIYLTKSRVSIPLQPRSLGRLKSLNIIIIIKLHLSQVQFNNNNNINNHNSKIYL